MTVLVSLDDARRQCRLADDQQDEDSLIAVYIAAAQRVCASVTGIDLGDAAIPPPTDADRAVLKQACLVMIAYWYDNRDATEAPRQAGWLLGTIRRRRL